MINKPVETAYIAFKTNLKKKACMANVIGIPRKYSEVRPRIQLYIHIPSVASGSGRSNMASRKIKTEMCPVCGGASFRASTKKKCDACFGLGYQTWQLVVPEQVNPSDVVQ